MILGIDIGATKTKAILWNKKIIKKVVFNTPERKSDLLFIFGKELEKIIITNQAKIKGIGLSIPGALDKKRKRILYVPHLKFLSQIDPRALFKKKHNKKIKMENDAVCFTIAEAVLGAARKERSILGITLGTGVGGGLILREKRRIRIYKGFFGAALEPGSMIMDLEKQKKIPQKANFDWFGSKYFFQAQGYDPEKLYYQAREGKRHALNVFKNYGEYLGIGIANLINILDPEVVVLGGGISKSFVFFSKTLQEKVRRLVLSPNSRKFVKIKKGKLGNFAGAIGAALLFQYDGN